MNQSDRLSAQNESFLSDLYCDYSDMAGINKQKLFSTTKEANEIMNNIVKARMLLLKIRCQ